MYYKFILYMLYIHINQYYNILHTYTGNASELLDWMERVKGDQLVGQWGQNYDHYCLHVSILVWCVYILCLLITYYTCCT